MDGLNETQKSCLDKELKMKIYVTRWESEYMSGVRAYSSLTKCKEAISQMQRYDKTLTYEFETHEFKPTKSDIISFFNETAWHRQ